MDLKRKRMQNLQKERKTMNKALFLDLDGTVRGTKGTKPCPNKPEDQYVLEGRKEVISKYKRDGYKIIAVTNQGGVGLGYMTSEDNKRCLADLNERLDFVFDDMLAATATPQDKHHWTKPRPGMLMHAADKHNIDLNRSIMVGDKEGDKGAAEAAGTKFQWAKDFFNDK